MRTRHKEEHRQTNPEVTSWDNRVTGNLITHEGTRSHGDISGKFRRVRLVRKDSSRDGVTCFVLEEQLLTQFTAEFMQLPSFSQKSL